MHRDGLSSGRRPQLTDQLRQVRGVLQPGQGSIQGCHMIRPQCPPLTSGVITISVEVLRLVFVRLSFRCASRKVSGADHRCACCVRHTYNALMHEG